MVPFSCWSAGYYIPSPGATNGNVNPCPAGKYSAAGAVQCKLCPVGSYFSSTGAKVCTTAPAGRYVPTTGSAAPLLSAPGYYISTTGMTSVATNKCVPGTYSFTGQSVCTKCAAGKISQEGVAECGSCPD